MPSTWTQNLYHMIFSTKNREPLLTPDVEARVHPLLGGITRDLGCVAFEVNGDMDHVHLALRFPSELSISELAQHLKGRSSSWMGETLPTLGFSWQNGSGGFTVSSSMLDLVIEYIRRQKEHHARVSFKDELRESMRLHGVDVDDSDLFQ